jgi:hypothetical protein
MGNETLIWLPSDLQAELLEQQGIAGINHEHGQSTSKAKDVGSQR